MRFALDTAPYIKHWKAQFLPYVEYIEEEEASLKEEDMDCWSVKEEKLVNLEIVAAKRAIEKMKKMLAALENDEWCGG